ncbi:hypothetical protein NB311A_14315 [Nitrobacter sp. Nb-311A]|nr:MULTISPECIES: CopG family antitoxin [unclassified Nitrobacter]EAQ35077.1 hypothetical protein NB311A_14315 [Nitrobacter sp. Nb-311A]
MANRRFFFCPGVASAYLPPSTADYFQPTAISLRLPVNLLEQIKIAANRRDVPYRSLIKMWLAEKVG